MSFFSRRPTAVAAVTASLALTAAMIGGTPARAASTGLIINEFYGRGGSANQPYTHKFVELYNPTAASISLSGLSIQYRSAGGTANATSRTELTGQVAPGDYFVLRLNSNGSNGEPLPNVDQTAAWAPSGTGGTIFLANTTNAASPDDTAAVIDKLGYASGSTISNSPEAAPAAYTGGNSTPGSLSRRTFVDTDDNSADFGFTEVPTPGAANTTQTGGGPTDPPTDPGPTTTSIAEIQGTGMTSPIVGRTVTTRGVVTAAYPTGGFNGFYLQTPGSGGQPKSAGDASDGLFAYGNASVGIGRCYDVTGKVTEFGGRLPEQKLTELTDITIAEATDCAPVVPTALTTLPATDADKEAYEGMLVHPERTWTITDNYDLNRFGQLGLAVGDQPLYTATDVVAAGAAAEAYEAENQKKLITLDDGSSWDYQGNATAKQSPLPYLSQETPRRTGSQLTFTRSVILDYRFQWNFQPTGQIVGHDDTDIPVTSENDREATVPPVGGDLQIASFNVLNYFTDLGKDEEGCGYYSDMDGTPVTTRGCQVRGAWSPEAFSDQKTKIVSAINGLDAEVVALMEIENSAGITYIDHERDYTLAQLVGELNAAGGDWAYAESPIVTPGNEDVIRTAFIYRRDTVQTLGASEILLDGAFANARYPLAQKFKLRKAGKPFVMVANHFKSKGSGEDDGTGQGLSNPSREAQARGLVQWANTRFADEAVFLTGDFNAYSKETPIGIIESAGYVNLAKQHEPLSATYQFEGRLGSLDHVLANAAAQRLVTGAAVWDINADESIAMQYSRRKYNIVDFHAPDQYASSDHDPVVVGLGVRR